MPFQKGYIPWNKDKAAPQISAALKGQKHPAVAARNRQLTGQNAKHWKGDDIGYYGLHAWVGKELGRPSLCTHCLSKDEKRYEWANISGNYKRDLTDWVRLCRKCHIKYDKRRGLWGKSSARKPQGVELF